MFISSILLVARGVSDSHLISNRMNAFLRIFIRSIPRYKGYLIIYVFLLILSNVLGLFGFAAIIPILRILFGMSDPNLQANSFNMCNNLEDYVNTLENNFFYYLQNQIEIHGNIWVLLMLCLFVVGVSLLSNVTSYFAYFFRIPIRTGVSRDIRNELYNKVIYMPIGYFTRNDKGDFISRMTSDAEEVEYGIASALDMLVEYPVSIIVYLITLFGISWRLTLPVFCAMLVVMGIVYVLGKYMKYIAFRGQRQRGKILSVFERTISSLKILKIYNLEKDYLDSFVYLNDSTRKTFNWLNRQYSIAFPLTDLLLTMVTAFLMWFGGRAVLDGNFILDTSVFIYYIIVFHSLIRPMRSFMKSTFAIQKSIASVERIGKILDIDSSEEHSKSQIAMPLLSECGETEPVLEFDNVSFSYQDNPNILTSINFKVYKNQTIVISGNMGSGKTTMMDLILKLHKVDSGEIRFLGVNIEYLPTKKLRETIGYANQDVILLNDTVLNNITLGYNNISVNQVERAAQITHIHDFIMTLPNGYNTVIGEGGSRLSGGQRQSVALARAIVREPSILILDEATSAMDTYSEHIVIREIKKMMCGKVLIIISHNKNIEEFADAVFFLQ